MSAVPADHRLLTVSQAYAALPADKRREFRQRVRERGIKANQLPIVPFPDRGGRFPLSHAQERLWFLWRLDPESSAYNLSSSVRLVGSLRADAVRAAVGSLIERHESLRKYFGEADGVPWQAVGKSRYGWHEEDISARSREEQDLALPDKLAALTHAPFDLRDGPLLRVAMLRLSASEHVLHFAMHHIISDGWSMDVLTREFVQAYRASHGGMPLGSAPLPIQYGDYAAWQREWLDVEELERQLAYWRLRLGAEHPILELPFSGRRTGLRSGQGNRIVRQLTPSQAAALRGLAVSGGTTLSTVMLAAYALLLSRYTNQQDVRIGIPVAGRNRIETEPLIGFFVNTLVIRGEFANLMRCDDLLSHMRDRVLEAQEHQDLPFSCLVDDLQPARMLDQTPLFQVMFNFSAAHPHDDARLPDLRVQSMPAQMETSRFDLVLHAVDGDALSVAFNYATDVFDGGTIGRLLDHYCDILDQWSRGARLLDDIQLKDTGEPRGVLAQHPFLPVTTRIAAQAARDPSRPALHCEGQRLAYGELDGWANRIGRHLTRMGVQTEERVGLCVTRSPGLVAGLLGVLKAGAAFVPLDPEYPRERLAYMLEDAGVRRVLADAVTARGLDWLPAGCAVVDIDELAAPDGAGDNLPWQVPVHPEQLAYVIYTSGSTGKPKGVAISQAAFSRHLDDFIGIYGITAADKQLQSSTINFDVSLHEMLPALAQGGQVEMRGPAAWDLQRTSRALAEEGVTFSRLPTAYWQQWLRDPPAADTLKALRQITVGGEGLPGDALARWFDGPLAGIHLDNLYGPTETTVACMYRRTRAEDAQQAVVSIGRPYPSRSVYVMDRRGNEVPIGGVGELCIGGDTLARGYLGRAALTAQQFVPDPYRDDGARLYRSGDMCRRRADGDMDFLGRQDQQLKLRGMRIELGEIEAVVRQAPGVVEAVVQPWGEGEAKRLVGYVVGNRAGAAPDDVMDGVVDMDAVRAWTQSRLPAYMVPAAWVTLDALPLLPSGKLDRQALPGPRMDVGEDGPVAAATPVQERLLTIWREVLGREDIGIRDNFFEAGGDSILALRVIAMALRQGLSLTPRQVFEYPDVERLAEQAVPAAADQVHVEIHDWLPLTPIQQVFFDRFPHGEAHWNQSVLLRVDAGADVEALGQAMDMLLASHDALRLRFDRGDGHWRQRVEPGSDVGVMTRVDLRGRTDWADRLTDACSALQKRLNLQAGPLLRACYFQLEDAGRLFIAIHHLAVDGVSWRILFDNLQGLYARLADGQPATVLASLPWSVWAQELSRYAAQANVREEQAWWARALRAATPLAGLLDETGHSAYTGEAPQAPRRSQLVLDAALTQGLLEHAMRAYKASIEDILLTALARAVRAWNDNAHVLVEMEGHGRETVIEGLDTAATVGWFTTRYPVLLPIAGEAGAAIVAVKEALRAVPHRGLHWGLLRLHDTESSRAGLKALARPEISFNYLGQFDQSLTPDGVFGFAGEATGPSMADGGRSPYAIDLQGLMTGGALKLTWTFSARVPEQGADSLIERFEAEIRLLARHCADAQVLATPSDFPLAALDSAALAELQLPWDQVQDIYPATPLQGGMLVQCLAQPDAGLYVVQKRMTLSGELDGAAMQSAWASVIARHDILRTHFAWTHGGAPLQVVRKHAAVPYALHDYTGYTAADYQDRLKAWQADDLTRGLDLARAPLLRINVFAAADGTHDVIWTGHHLVTDGWSGGQLLGEILHAYRARKSGAAGPTLPAPRQFKEYVRWLSRQPDPRDWWRSATERLRDPALALPSLGSRTAKAASEHRPFLPCQRVMEIDTALQEAVRTRARASQVTMNTLVQGAWALLLARLGNRDQSAFGVTVTGRPAGLPGMEHMLGMFINSLPLWIDVPASMTVAEWLRRIQDQNSSLREVEHSDLARVQQWIGRSGEALFDSLVVFDNYAVDEALREGPALLTLDRLEAVETTHYPLVLTAAFNDKLAITLKWDAARIDDAAARHLCGAYLAALRALARDGEALLADVGITDAAEREVLRQQSRPVNAYPAAELIHERIAAHAERRPGAVAIMDSGRSHTYGDIDTRANRLAHRLVALGVGKESLVGVAMARGADLVVALLAVLKAGAAYLPLDPAYPRARQEYLVQDSGLSLLLTESGARARLPDVAVPLLVVDEEDLSTLPATRVETRLHPDNLAYVIYTSGSTGQPKGAQLTHRNVARLLASTQADFAFDEHDVWTLFHSYAFDFSVWEIFGALCHGGRLVIVPYDTSRSPQAMLALLREYGVTVLNQTPSAFGQLAQIPDLDRTDDLALRVVIFGGEALDPRTLRPWVDRFGVTRPRLVNMYGITETTVHVTHRVIEAGDVARGASPIGRQLPDLGMYVLDRAGQLAADGAVGELYVSGAGLARGYLGRPGLTADRFVPDPDDGAGGRLYRTGDAARRGFDGELTYQGRVDDQVKVRGHRIELGELQAHLQGLPGVAQAVVLARVGATGPQLVAYATARPGVDLDGGALREAMARQLPEHMVPATVQVLTRMPLTPNGKVDRAALPEPVFTSSAYEAPRGEREKTVARVWEEVLGLERVGREDNFFALGGDSILSLQIVARINRLGYAATPKHLFDAPTVAGMAAVLPLALAPVSGEVAAPMSRPDVARLLDDPDNVEDIYPATPLQNGMLFHSLLQDGQGVYVNQKCFTLGGHLDVARFEASWALAFERHAILRTAFTWRHGGDALQVVARRVVVPMTVHADAPADARTYPAFLSTWRQADLARGFDLETAPLLRINLFRRPDGDHDCVITDHHALLDGWSDAQLIGEIIHTYKALAAGKAAQLPAPGRYGDYVSWVSRQPSTEGWWRQHVEGEEAARLGSSLLQPGSAGVYATERLRHHVHELDEAATEALARAARHYGVTVNTLVQGAWALLLGRLGDKRRAVFGITVSGRPSVLPGVEHILGLFINSLPLWVRVPGDSPLSAWFGDLQTANGELRERSHASVSQVQQWTGLAGEALFDSLLVFENYPIDKAMRSGDSEVTIREVALTERTHYPMVLVAVPGVHTRFRWKFDSGRIDEAAVGRLATQFLHILDQFADTEGIRTLAEVKLLMDGPARASRALHVFFPAATRIAAQAARDPSRPALHCEGRRLAYGELDGWANRIGRHLTRMGVRTEERVGLCVTRSPGLVAGLLGVLKAGAAFVPLDPEYPRERLAYMLEDAGVRRVLADAVTARGLDWLPAGCAVVDIDELAAPDGAGDNLPWQVPVHPEQLAYVIYTSGSTGKPKGVAISQAAFSRHLDDFIGTYRITAADKQLQSSTINFDVSLHEMLPALAQGGQVEMRGPAAWDLQRTSRALAEEGVTFSRLPTAYWQQWLRDPPAADTLKALRQITVGGEGLPGDALARWFDGPLAGIHLDNLYGPTETTVACMYRRTRAEDAQQAVVSIGRPYPSRSVYVLDRRGNEVPIGGVGELCIGGDTLARGYLGRAALTAQQFVPDPYRDDGARLYRSGDMCRRRADGDMDFLGRQDQQLKLRGMRIELGEIEAVVRQAPGVVEAVVQPWGEGEAKRLVGYVVGNRAGAAPDDVMDGVVDMDAVRAWTQSRLPAYMVPAAWVTLDALPLLPSGKLDRQALPGPRMDVGENGPVAAATPVQERLLTVWREVLGRENIGIRDNFFEAGGDSILALRTIALLKARGETQVSLAMLFEGGTVEAVAALAGNNAIAKPPSNVIALNRCNGDDAAQATLFAIHPGYGFVSEYQDLAMHVAPDIQVYGLASPIHTETDWWPGRMSDVAQDYAARIRRVQPTGPYRLLGWSTGGNLAVAVARVFEAQGNQVAFLGVVDALASPPARRADDLPDAEISEADVDDVLDWVRASRTRLSYRLDDDAALRGLARQALRVVRHFESLAPDTGANPLRVVPTLWFAGQPNPDHVPVRHDAWRAVFEQATVLADVIDTDHLGIIRHPAFLESLKRRLGASTMGRPAHEQDRRAAYILAQAEEQA
ncbi:hypothetical protein CAL29_14770 [Bordetella genomosp. 10]|uniref:Carrier domain-containing protein n=1 Tax=Bordetella genomosp. 10 TaxID=1416804 RepID=A0A261SEE8_9BORD|nr:non-ribosomal peptide synthetase [Bordetella genomosp. 10]OZI34733.1 hypothetical protein CAL29_14770 [Bordetella genomosp. 10]